MGARDHASAARTDPAAAVLDMLCQAMAALSVGRSADDIVCRQLGHALAADATVAIALLPDEAPVLATVYPDTRASRQVAENLLAREWMSAGGGFLVEYDDGIGHLASLIIRASAPTGQGRVLVFNRATPFGAADRLLLDKASDALLALWPLAERAVRVHAADDWVHESAASTRMTERELQVLGLLADGLLATSIASRLQLSPRTVHKHLGNIYRKLGVHDRLVAVSLARLQGLVDGYMSGPYPTSPVSPALESRVEGPLSISR